MALITRTHMIDDDGSGEVGTVLNDAWLQAIYNQIDAVVAASQSEVITSAQNWTMVTTTAVGVQNSFNPGINRNTIIRCANASLLTITGFPQGFAGQLIRLYTIGAGQIDLPYYDSRSPTADRLVNYVTSAPTSLAPGTAPTRAFAEYQWVATDGHWLLRSHEQGAFITAPYNSADFVGIGTTAGAIQTSKYRLHGRELRYLYSLNGCTFAGGTQLQIRNGQWGGFTATHTVAHSIGYLNDGTIVPGYAQVNNGSTSILLSKNSAAAWAASGSGFLQGTAFFEVL